MSNIAHAAGTATIGSLTMPAQDNGPLLQAMAELTAAVAKIQLSVAIPEMMPKIEVNVPPQAAPNVTIEAKLPEQAVASITVNVPAWPLIASAAIPCTIWALQLLVEHWK
jgi:hypothetical protein